MYFSVPWAVHWTAESTPAQICVLPGQEQHQSPPSNVQQATKARCFQELPKLYSVYTVVLFIVRLLSYLCSFNLVSLSWIIVEVSRILEDRMVPTIEFTRDRLLFLLLPLRPASHRNCTTDACALQWRVGPWTQCTATCGRHGFQSRHVTCVHRRNGKPVREFHCAWRPRPASWQRCNILSCGRGTYHPVIQVVRWQARSKLPEQQCSSNDEQQLSHTKMLYKSK